MGRAERAEKLYLFRRRVEIVASAAIAAAAIGAGGIGLADLVKTSTETDAAIADIRAELALPECKPPNLIKPSIPTTVPPEPDVRLLRAPVIPPPEPCRTPQQRADLFGQEANVWKRARIAHDRQLSLIIPAGLVFAGALAGAIVLGRNVRSRR